MKKVLGFFVMAIFGLASCHNNGATPGNLNNDGTNDEVTFDVKAEFTKMNDVLKQYDEPSQFFKVSANKPTQVKGKQGSVIAVNPTDLETQNGQPLGKNIDVELKELTSQHQLLRANAQTVSNGKLLVSGGAYFINMTSDGNQLKLKKGKTLSVEFPKITSDEMYLFYGQRDTLGQLNWEKVDQKFESKPIVSDAPTNTVPLNTVYFEVNNIDIAPQGFASEEEEKAFREKVKKKEDLNKAQKVATEKIYKAMELQQFGWINCDRFYDIPNKTNLDLAFNPKDSIFVANIYLVFKDMNSVMQESYCSLFGGKSTIKNIPVGEKAQLVAVSVENGKIYTYKSDLTIQANQTIYVKLKETGSEDIEKLFQ